jgi:hypothetical protein
MSAYSPSHASVWKLWRIGLLVLATTALTWALCFRFPVIWVVTGIGEPNRPFLDLYALLAACDAQRLGLNPLLPNPLDPYNRPFGFSSWWFEITALGWGRKDLIWLGTTLLAVSLLLAGAMTRPKNWRQGFWLGLLLISPAFLLSVNRANQDLVIFVVVSLGLASFRSASSAWRALGVVLLAAAAVLKYFPLVTVVLLLEFRSRRGVLGGAALYALVLLLAWPSLESSLRLAGRHAPAPDWLYAFGAPTLGRDFGVTNWLAWAVPVVIVVGWAVGSAFRSLRKNPVAVPDGDGSIDREFICGASMLIGVFFLGVSYVYKLVFAVWLLRWLWQRRRGHEETGWARAIGALLMIIAWLEGVTAILLNLVTGFWSVATAQLMLKVVLAAAQLFEWGLIACLLRFLCLHVLRRRRLLWGRYQVPAENPLLGETG